MKKITLLSAIFALNLSINAQNYKQLIDEGTHTVEYISEVAELHFDKAGRSRGTGYKPFKRWQYFAERVMDETGKLKPPKFYYNELENYNARINEESITSRTTVGTWEEMGPTSWNATAGWNPGVGRITSIAVEENNLNHIIAGANTGGVWKSTDGGSTWTVLTDNLANIDVYALAIDPLINTTYYWGSTGGSIFKSTDSGATWSLHSSFSRGTVNKILIDPTNTSKMYASVQGEGLYKSTNGGTTWTTINSSTTTGYDFEFKPGDTNTVYASGTNFYKSTDGGVTFNIVIFGNQFSDGAKMIGVSGDDSSVIYVLEASGSVFGSLHKSTNDGDLFIKLDHTDKNYFGYSTTANDDRGQAPRDMDIAVSPNDANDVHIAGINTWRSTDGGANFDITSQWMPDDATALNIGYCHADVDILQFIGTGASTKLFVGTDGGIYRADNPTTVNSTYYTDLTSGMGIRQFYKIGISQTNPVIVTGGSQDNGTSVLATNGNWTDWLGADGMEGFVDKNDSQIMYGTTQFGDLNKTTNGGASRSNLTNPAGDPPMNETWNWIVPFEQDPITQNTIYVTYRQVYKSVDGGNNWTTASQNFGTNIDQFKVAPTNNNYMYLAINGAFWYTTNAGVSWTKSTFDGGSINDIAVHPTNPSKLAIATTSNEKVYISTDNGVTWSSIKWDIPNFSSQAVTWQNNGDDGLYVGMNYGIYYTDNTLGNTWAPFNNGLPNVRINELEINTADSKIYAATYGRGLWRSNIYDRTLSVNDFEFEDLSLYPNPAKNQVNLKWNKPENVSVRIYSTLGKLMFYAKKMNLQNGLKMDVSSYNAGLYFVKLNSNKGEITKKLILK